MPRVLHLLKTDHDAGALAIIARQLEAGDTVAVALLEGAPPPALPAGVKVYRVPAELPYAHLLDLIFESDSVITW